MLRWLSAALISAMVPLAAQTLLVLNKEGALAMVDPATRKVVGRVRTGDSPHEVVASSDGKLAFVSNYGGTTPGNSISVIDVVGRRELRRVDLGVLRRPHGLDFAEGKLYFTSETNQLIGRYDPAANTIDWLLGTGQTGTHMVIVKPDTHQIFTANIGANSVTIIDEAGVQNWSETHLAVGKGPEGFDLSPDGKQLWAAHSRDGAVSVIDLFRKSVVQTFSVQTKRSNRLKFTPDGRLVLISDLEGDEVLVLERATKKVIKRLKLGRNPAGILVPPDSSRAYIAMTGDNNVVELDLKTFDLIARLQTGTGPDGMAWIAGK